MVGIIGVIFFFLGILLMLIAGIWGLVLAFQDSVVWGLLYLIPITALVFIIKNWSKRTVRNSFFLFLTGLVATGSGVAVSGWDLRNRVTRQQMQDGIGSGDEPFPLDGPTNGSMEENATNAEPGGASSPPLAPAPTSESDPAATTNTAPETTPQPTASPPAANASPDDYHQTMMVGYQAYGQGDYQTALINFKRALEMKPGDELATEAIQNTEAAIAAN